MPKHTVTITFKDFVKEHECPALDDLADYIIEYAPDFDFPANAEHGSISWHDHVFKGGDLHMEFEYDEEEEEEEDEDLDDEDLDDE